MSASHFPSRSSIDLGPSKPQPQPTRVKKSHPPRLQHSPSLPNIWFPPRSGPLPTKMSEEMSNSNNKININQGLPKRPTTPPKISLTLTSPPSSIESADSAAAVVSALEKPPLEVPELRRSVTTTGAITTANGDSIDIKSNTPLHARKRQRKDKDSSSSHHLLTPPLTPSSSIRTTASVESEGKQLDAFEALRRGLEPDATRFLLIENVSRTLSPTMLQDKINEALSHISSRKPSAKSTSTLDIRANTNTSAGGNTSCIKDFFLPSTGTLVLVFYDVRDALAAKAVLSTRSDGPLADCLDKNGVEFEDSTHQRWLLCRFITADELVKIIGNSTFLPTTDGGFLLSASLAESCAGEDAQADAPKREIDVNTLVQMLEAYGDLRLFRPQKLRPSDQDNFMVEFFDVRDASEAYTALNVQTMFGMTLATSGRVTALDTKEGDTEDTFPSKPATARAQNRSETPTHQPSASESHIVRLGFGIGPPGEASQMRERFTGQNMKSHLRAMSAGNEMAVSASGTPSKSEERERERDERPDAASPTFFYTSYDFGDPFVDSPSKRPGYGRDYASELVENRMDNEWRERNEGGMNRPWEVQQTQTCSIVDCRYCPSKGQDYTPTAQVRYNQFNPSYANAIPFPSPSPQTFIGPGEYEQPQNVFPGANCQWLFDPNLVVPASNTEMFNPPFLSPIPVIPVEPRFQESHSHVFLPGGLIYPAIPSPVPVHPQVFIEPHPAMGLPARDQSIFIPNPSPDLPAPIPVSQNLDTNGAGVHVSPGVNDRNFLNITRIEEGSDTRTTVMIKNIPNKMTAKDLIQYINEVCPRKIDFLYLRMDFKNGCNVGYAFVNFIYVEDMLKFAKKRLGVKWNMFSSEKVLQMSYANYQGKEALVEKFRNSCIMDEREEWRPKIFYSSGPEQGLPEPFPAPTHLRRKERSSHNRGALFVPGISGDVGASTRSNNSAHGHLTVGPSRRQDYFNSASGVGLSHPKYLEHRNRNADRRHGGGRM